MAYSYRKIPKLAKLHFLKVGKALVSFKILTMVQQEQS